MSRESGTLAPPRKYKKRSDLSFRYRGLTRIRVGGRLNYKEIRSRFERQSTFHGISHAALAPNSKWRAFWHTIFFCCFCALVIQVIILIGKYRGYPKTVDLDLKFENAPFPSITLCNLNPYKKSLIYGNPITKSTMDAFANLGSRGIQSEGAAAILGGIHRAKRDRRPKRKRKNPRRYHQVYAQCLCDYNPLTMNRRNGSCLAKGKGGFSVPNNATNSAPLNLMPEKCMCQLDSVSHALWPCFPWGSWKENVCKECVDDSGHCPMRFYRGKERYEDIKHLVDLCHCHKEYNHCVQNNDDGIIPTIEPDDEIRDINITKLSIAQLEQEGRRTTTTTTTMAPAIVQALGFSEVTDELAQASVATQNLMFAVGDMEYTDKVELSHTQDEFILKCSFNQKDCNISTDFKLHYDQTYGNCYTFNWDRFSAVVAHRAGANYGLKVMLYANVSEYLPTSEAVGFRITVHDKWIVPFPDAFGYNAPTGFLSSFGVRMKQFLRIMAPHGHCRKGGEDSEDFIYQGFNYSVEACHRSCTQKKICEICKCADPMYPLPKNGNFSFCKVTDTEARDCIRATTVDLGIKIAEGKVEDCSCHQPCTETNYEVTYSAARWPSGASKVAECSADNFICLEKYRRNAAMIQIFYEELNYETLMETEAYSFSSFMADFGGLTGLWIGASVVSFFEVVSLFFFTAQAYVHNKKEEKKDEGSEKSNRNSINTLHKLSVQEMRMSISTHSSRSKGSLHSSRSHKPSIHSMRSSHKSLDEPLAEGSEEVSSEGSPQGSCRYLPPGEELPCLCKYNEMGHIVVMKALCPVHGYMVRRNYDYSVSNSEEGEEDDDPEIHQEPGPYFTDPFPRESFRRSTKRKKKPHLEEDAGMVVEGGGSAGASMPDLEADAGTSGMTAGNGDGPGASHD